MCVDPESQLEALNELIKKDIPSTQKKWILMEVYLKNISKIKDKSIYVGAMFPFFIKTLNEANRRYHQYRLEVQDKLEVF